MPTRFVISTDFPDNVKHAAQGKMGMMCDIRSEGHNGPNSVQMKLADELLLEKSVLADYLDAYRFSVLNASVIFIKNVAFWPGPIGSYYAQNHLLSKEENPKVLAESALSSHMHCPLWRDYFYRAAFVAFEEFASRNISHVWLEGYALGDSLDVIAGAAKDAGILHNKSFDLEVATHVCHDACLRDKLPAKEDMIKCKYVPFEHERVVRVYNVNRHSYYGKQPEASSNDTIEAIEIDFTRGMNAYQKKSIK